MSLTRTPEFVFREAKLFGEEELRQYMRRKKKGEWSDDDTQWLICRRSQGLPLTKMVRLLRGNRQLGPTILEVTAGEEGP